MSAYGANESAVHALAASTSGRADRFPPEDPSACLADWPAHPGCLIMIAADAQKCFMLRLKRGLITDARYRFIRHPNYLGEMMIYGSFVLIVWHWLPIAVMTWVWEGVLAVNMECKR